MNSIIILRCCRDWPIQAHSAMIRGGTCGYCKKFPEVVFELYDGPNCEFDDNGIPIPNSHNMS